VMLCLLVSV